MNRMLIALTLALTGLAGATVPARAADMPEYKLVIKNQQFDPATLKVPANTKFRVLVTNQDAAPSEFESNDFNREKIVRPGSAVTGFIGPLKPGQYKFFDDFHQDTGQGVLVVE